MTPEKRPSALAFAPVSDVVPICHPAPNVKPPWLPGHAVALKNAEQTPSLAEFAAYVNLSPHHFHRLFRRIAGVTPKAYAAAHRQSRVQHRLAAGASVTEKIYDAGFNSSGPFYEAPQLPPLRDCATRQRPNSAKCQSPNYEGFRPSIVVITPADCISSARPTIGSCDTNC